MNPLPLDPESMNIFNDLKVPESGDKHVRLWLNDNSCRRDKYIKLRPAQTDHRAYVKVTNEELPPKYIKPQTKKKARRVCSQNRYGVSLHIFAESGREDQFQKRIFEELRYSRELTDNVPL